MTIDDINFSKIKAHQYPILSSVAAYSRDDVWVVGSKWSGYPSGAQSDQIGARSLVLHWDGGGWAEVPDPDPSYIQQLFGVAVVNGSDVWVVGTSSDNEDSSDNGMIAHLARCSGNQKNVDANNG